MHYGACYQQSFSEFYVRMRITIDHTIYKGTVTIMIHHKAPYFETDYCFISSSVLRSIYNECIWNLTENVYLPEWTMLVVKNQTFLMQKGSWKDQLQDRLVVEMDTRKFIIWALGKGKVCIEAHWGWIPLLSRKHLNHQQPAREDFPGIMA